MGISILELVIRQLREAGFQADGAYPGQQLPSIQETVAAAHIDKVDRTAQAVTVEVDIISPAAFGGAACELEALRATEVLRWLGAKCVQNGCRYDALSQVYLVPVLAEFTAVTGAEEYVMGPGFHIYINEVNQKYAVGFTQEETVKTQAEYSIGQSAPAAVRRLGSGWAIALEELVPVGYAEQPEPEDGFILKVITDKKTHRFLDCHWETVRREYTRQGLRRIFRGTAARKEELL